MHGCSLIAHAPADALKVERLQKATPLKIEALALG